MPYLVIARKYRPQTFSEVSGQDVVAKTLTNAIATGRIHHAYLFTGPRGVGKTSMARILAKALCCVGKDGGGAGPTATPCGTCDQCRMITEGTHPDVAEIDAARFSGVDSIRELSDGAAFAPSSARYRIYILDEVHMLSTPAWNALLKTLEEPPPHLRFIFATTEVDRVLPTVLSRVQRFDFRAIGLPDIVRRLREICARERVELADAVLARIARAAGGGMRDAQTLLDQLIAVSDGKITEEDLILLLGAARGGDVQRLAEQLLGGTAKEALAILDQVVEAGVAPTTLLDQLIELLRGIMLVQACGAESPAVRRLELDATALAAHASVAAPEKVLRICQILIGSQQSIRHGVDPRLQLELATVRICALGQLADVDTLLRRIERQEVSAAPPEPRGLAAARPR